MKIVKPNYKYNHILLVLFYITALIDVCFGQPQYVRFILLFLMIALTFTNDFVFSLPLILILNDALGTIFGSALSFYWAASGLVFVKKILKRDLSIGYKATIFLAFGLLYSIYSMIVQYNMDTRQPLVIFIYFFIVAYIVEQIDKEKVSLKSVMLAFGYAVAVAAFQMAFFGGIDYTSYSYQVGNEEWTKASRYGLIGTGAGDPNYSGLSLLLGLICIWSSNTKKIIKLVLSVLFVYCIVKTVSITTFLIALLLLLFAAIIQQGMNKKLKLLFGILCGAIVLYLLIIIFPVGSISEQVSLYYYRLQSKLNFLSTGDINELTTDRSGSVIQNINYALNRDFVKLIFGLDRVPPTGLFISHNTYVDVMIRFGVIGVLIYIIIIVRKIIRTFKINSGNYSDRNLILSLKLLFIAFTFTLSIYSGSNIALLSWILLFL